MSQDKILLFLNILPYQVLDGDMNQILVSTRLDGYHLIKKILEYI